MTKKNYHIETWRRYFDRRVKDLTELEFQRFYGTEKDCQEVIRQYKWPGSFQCYHCSSNDEPYVIRQGRVLECRVCKKQETLLKGTAFENSKISIQVWFYAFYLWRHSRKRLTANTLKKKASVSLKTAQKMLEHFQNQSIWTKLTINAKHLEHFGKKYAQGSDVVIKTEANFSDTHLENEKLRPENPHNYYRLKEQNKLNQHWKRDPER